jgi:hypothetical protein
LREQLLRLAQVQGYRGAESDLLVLKDRSRALKSDPVINQNAILFLDNAIASHGNEIRAAVSNRALASRNEPGSDIFPAFTQQKLDFLSTNAAKFYDGGPFEITSRSLLASTLEAKYFLEQKAGVGDSAKLLRAVQVLDEIVERRTRPQYAYLSGREIHINSDRFWRASLLFALGDKMETRETLRDLVLNSQPPGLDTGEKDDIYIYRIFTLPHQLIVERERDRDRMPKVSIKDPHLLDKSYNSAQLALYACALVDKAGEKGVPDFIDGINRLVLSDYFVVVGPVDDAGALKPLQEAISKALASKDLLDRRGQTLERVSNAEIAGFSDAIKQGAQQCGIDDRTRDQIYASFTFASEVKQFLGKDKKEQEYLLFGGRLNARQASILADFVNNVVLQTPEVNEVRKNIKADTDAYSARRRRQ